MRVNEVLSQCCQSDSTFAGLNPYWALLMRLGTGGAEPPKQILRLAEGQAARFLFSTVDDYGLLLDDVSGQIFCRKGYSKRPVVITGVAPRPAAQVN